MDGGFGVGRGWGFRVLNWCFEPTGERSFGEFPDPVAEPFRFEVGTDPGSVVGNAYDDGPSARCVCRAGHLTGR